MEKIENLRINCIKMGNIFLTTWKTNALMKIFTIVMVDDFRKHVL